MSAGDTSAHANDLEWRGHAAVDNGHLRRGASAASSTRLFAFTAKPSSLPVVPRAVKVRAPRGASHVAPEHPIHWPAQGEGWATRADDSETHRAMSGTWGASVMTPPSLLGSETTPSQQGMGATVAGHPLAGGSAMSSPASAPATPAIDAERDAP
jgi:hypothetical protein